MTTTKRRASKAERDHAAALVRAYREPERAKTVDGRTVELRLTGDDLVRELERFAQDGTFLQFARDVVRDVRTTNIRHMYAYRRARGVSQEQALGAVADLVGVSDQTVRDTLYRRKRGAKKRPA